MSKELKIPPDHLAILARYENDIALIKNILTEPESQAISLRFGLVDGQQLSTKNVATVMGISDARVRTLISNGMERLQNHRPDKDQQVDHDLSRKEIAAYLNATGFPVVHDSRILQADLIYYLLEKQVHSDLMQQMREYFHQHSLPIREELTALSENMILNQAALEYISLRHVLFSYRLDTSPSFFEWREKIENYTPNQKLALIFESSADHLLIGNLSIGQLVCFAEHYIHKKTPLEIWREYCIGPDGSAQNPRVEVIEEILTQDLPTLFDIVLYFQSIAQALVDSANHPHTWETIRIDTFIRDFIRTHKKTLGLDRVIFTE